MKLYTKKEVLDRIEREVRKSFNAREAAEAIGCTRGQLSLARADKVPVPPAILKAIKLQRAWVYVDKADPDYLDGGTLDPLDD